MKPINGPKVISKDTLHDIEKEWEYIESKIEINSHRLF